MKWHHRQTNYIMVKTPQFISIKNRNLDSYTMKFNIMPKQINLNQALVCLRYHLEIRVSSQQSAAAAYWLASGAWITPAPVLSTFPWQSSSCTWMTFTTWAQTLDVRAWWSWRFELTNIRGIEQSLPYLHSLSTVVLETKRHPV